MEIAPDYRKKSERKAHHGFRNEPPSTFPSLATDIGHYTPASFASYPVVLITQPHRRSSRSTAATRGLVLESQDDDRSR